MKKSNFNYNNEYYNSGTRSRYSSQSSRRLRSEWGGRSTSNNSRNRFYNRIEKACTTFNPKDVSKEVYLCRKQIERLEKELLKKDKIIFELRETNMHGKEIETELVETYRVLYMYEGKISQYERELKKMELALSSKVPKDITLQVQELLESYRVDNGELSAQLEERSKVVIDMEVKLKKMENKYFNTVWKLSSTKREVANPLKKRFPNLRNTITINQTPLLEKEKALNMQTKALNIQTNAKGKDFQNEYQISNDRNTREKAMVTFNRVQPLKPQQVQQTPIKSMQEPNLPPRAPFNASKEPYSFFKNTANTATVGSSNSLNNMSNRVVKYSSGEITPVNFQSATPVQQSNPNISSQMTVSNGGTSRRVEVKELKMDSPRMMEIRSNNQRYAVSKDLNEVNNMVRNVERKVSYLPGKTTVVENGSIYLN